MILQPDHVRTLLPGSKKLWYQILMGLLAVANRRITWHHNWILTCSRLEARSHPWEHLRIEPPKSLTPYDFGNFANTDSISEATKARMVAECTLSSDPKCSIRAVAVSSSGAS